jgi:hypothetical protein
VALTRSVKRLVRSCRLKNDDISELHIFAITDYYRQKWKEHLNKMPDEGLLKSILDYYP